MSFSAREQSRTLGEPINLYLFRYGEPSDAFYAYTDAEQHVVHAGITYAPIPIDRDSLKSSGTLDKASLTIRLPDDSGLALLFRQFPPSHVITLIIRQGHVDDNEFLVAWSGRVLNAAAPQPNEIELTCDPISTSFRRTMLRRHYQLGCPHVLYGAQCKASKAAATIQRQPTQVIGTTLRFPVPWEEESRKAKYAGGSVSWTLPDGRTEIREIIRIVGAQDVVISASGPNLSAGTTVTLTLGCNHQMSDCQDLHANIQNYGGQPWIPTQNPIGIRNNFY